MNNLKACLKSKSAEKGKLSRKIGDLKDKGLDYSDLLCQVQAISSEIKALKKQLKGQPKEELSGAPQSKLAPQHFSPALSGECPIGLSVHRACDSHISAWNEYVINHERSSAYHRYEFKGIIQENFGHNSEYLYAQNAQNKIVGVLPFFNLKSALFGNFNISMPFFNYGSALGDNLDIEEALIESAIEHCQKQNVEHLELRDTYPRQKHIAKQEKFSFYLALPDTAEALWQQIGSKVRSQIKKADEYSPSVKVGGLELLTDFYRVFSRNMRDLGTPVYGKEFFASILRSNALPSTLIISYIRNKPAGAALLIGHNDTLEIPWASTIRSMNQYNVNMYMYWQVLSYAIAEGYAFFDFGRSSENTGTYNFKKQWGAKPLPLYWHYWMNEGEDLPQINPNNSKYKLLIKIWQQMPVWLANTIGPHVVKNIP